MFHVLLRLPKGSAWLWIGRFERSKFREMRRFAKRQRGPGKIVRIRHVGLYLPGKQAH